MNNKNIVTDIRELSPQLVWKYFYDFTQTPRPSKHEELIVKYLIDFAKSNRLEYKQDKTGNVVITKPATTAKKDAPTVALQGHIDMVCEKNSDIDFDFLTQPIEAYIDGDWVKAKGTTLGADCGIGCAIMLAILASNNIEHPAIEALFTVDEETGLTGAFGISDDMISAKYLINLDSEDSGEVFVGCAGGIDTVASFPIEREPIEDNYLEAIISVKGLNGGHSGDDISKNLGNANKLVARFMLDFLDDIKIVDIDGGNLRNAIARECKATVIVKSKMLDSIIKKGEEYNETLKREYFCSEPNVEFMVSSKDSEHKESFTADLTNRVVKAVVLSPDGVLAMSQDMENFVETSTNLASVKIKGGNVVISTSQRSSVESRKKYWASVIKMHFENFKANVNQSDGYPGWTPVLNSHLLDVFKEQHKEVLGYDIKVKAIHAGLECGLFLAKFPHLEMVSYGPTLRGVHSPNEKLNIKDTEDAWKLITAILKTI